MDETKHECDVSTCDRGTEAPRKRCSCVHAVVSLSRVQVPECVEDPNRSLALFLHNQLNAEFGPLRMRKRKVHRDDGTTNYRVEQNITRLEKVRPYLTTY